MSGGRRQRTGRLGEMAARRHLESQGYAVRGVNVRVGRGEIDIVADEGGDVVFVEVRTRRGGGLGTPEESITAGKRGRMMEAAMRYLQETGEDGRSWRIDVVAVELDKGRDVIKHLRVIRDAVEGD